MPLFREKLFIQMRPLRKGGALTQPWDLGEWQTGGTNI